MTDDGERRGKCYVVMPYTVREEHKERYGNEGTHWSEVYDALIKPAVLDAGLIPFREDDDPTSKVITNRIWRGIEEADIVLCDLSSENPNVMVEVGWTLRADRKFVLIRDDLTQPTFDLQNITISQYSHKLRPGTLARDIPLLSKTLRAMLEQKDYSILQQLNVAQPANALGQAEALIQTAVEKAFASMQLGGSQTKSGARVIVFWRAAHFTEADALELSARMAEHGIKCANYMHYDERPPDAIFVSPAADPAVVGRTLRYLTVVPRFIFPVDYPDHECGATSGADISIGLSSAHREHNMIEAERPYPLSRKDYTLLLDPRLTPALLSETLQRIAPSRSSSQS